MDNITDIQQKFDVKQFNVNFDAMKTKTYAESEIIEASKLKALYEKDNLPKVPIYLQTPEEILFNLKRTWFEIYDDFLKNGISVQIFDKGDRLFYIGITFLFFALTLYAIYVLFDFEENSNKDIKEKTIIEKHFYHLAK